MDKIENGIKKNSNFTYDEEQILVSLVDKYKNIVEYKKSGSMMWKQKDAWKNIEKEFACTSGKFRSSKNLKEKYLNLKKRTKKKLSLLEKYSHLLTTRYKVPAIKTASLNIRLIDDTSSIDTYASCGI
ncbi:hypothetical protein Zmor_006822 [Zophobas morio]|uniref:Regulatory protein zeste n=1 Tax=Zophobas morio TaxID=2755281 RepID=A0AA38J0M7_9CUCU|nr:hypothetical protein Zmor_006822 [Zophobas morio]